ncbi:MAG: hypothetical protein EOP33_08095 [Rickettsiaceae bacterium]|nr:MAG: hypothetical protein EOP33_08095 [Rickettsiaceae bacterium]
MLAVAIILFKEVYTNTDSVEVALLELKRLGWSQNDAVSVLIRVFDTNSIYAENIVANSVAWSK